MSQILSLIVKTTGEGADAYYVPTVAGYALIVIILLVLLLLVSLISGEKKFNAKQLAFSSVALALAAILSNIKLFHMPMGGSITLLSMFFVTIIGYMFGLKVGVIAAIAYGLIQLMLGAYIIHPLQLCIDYIFSFGALGLSGLFSKTKHGLITGYWVAILARLLFSALSGLIFFASAAADYNMIPWVYSLVYNAGYIIPEAVITTVIIVIPPVRKGLEKIKEMAE